MQSPEVGECGEASHLVLLAHTPGLDEVQLGNLHLGVGLKLLGQLVPHWSKLLTVIIPRKCQLDIDVWLRGSGLPGSVELDESVAGGHSSSKTPLGENMKSSLNLGLGVSTRCRLLVSHEI